MQSQLKILFLDDHAGLRDSLGTFLSNKNPALQFYYAGNKDEALKILTENPDIKNAIVDINKWDKWIGFNIHIQKSDS